MPESSCPNTRPFHRGWLIAGVVGFVLLYGLNARTVPVGDSLAHLYVSESLIHSFDFDLRESEEAIRSSPGGELPYYVVEDRGRIRSVFSFLPGILLVPFVLAMKFLLGPGVESLAWAGKLGAAAMTFAAGVLLWRLLAERVGRPIAAFAVAAFWFASPLWALSMMYLQHQPMIMLRLAALLVLFGRRDAKEAPSSTRALSGGLLLGMSVLARYQSLLTAIPLALIFIIWHRREIAAVGALCLGGAATAASLFWYNAIHTGSPFDTGYVVYPWAVFTAPFFSTFVSLFLNPSKGLLVHSPWLLFAAIPYGHFIRRRECPMPFALNALISPWPLILLYTVYTGWFGGWTWGYRFLLDVLPELMILAALGLSFLWAKKPARWIAAALFVSSFAVQTLGALTFDTSWHATHDLGTMPHQHWLSQVRHGQLGYYARRRVIYIGPRRIALGENPFETRGFYPPEQWGERRVAWTRPGGGSFLFMAREEPVTLRLFPSPAAQPDDPLIVGIRLNGQPLNAVRLQPGGWLEMRLEDIPFQYSAVVTVKPDRTWDEPEEGGRSLGVAVEF